MQLLVFGLELIDFIVLLVMVVVASMIERRSMANVQKRDGPVCVGVHGIGHPLLDATKLIVQLVSITDS